MGKLSGFFLRTTELQLQKERYLLTATLRQDGSSRFSKSNRWGTLPSAALAWSIINEPFMEKARDIMSNLKLRVGYGVTGQQEITDYLYITNYSLGNNTTSQYMGSYLLKPDGYSPDLKMGTDCDIQCRHRLRISEQSYQR